MKKILIILIASLSLSTITLVASNAPLVTQQTMQTAVNQLQLQISKVQDAIPKAVALQAQKTQAALSALQKDIQEKITDLQQQIKTTQQLVTQSHNALVKQMDGLDR